MREVLDKSPPVWARTIVRGLRGLQFRGKVRVLDRLVGRRGIVCERIFGSWIELDLSEFVQRWIFYGVYGIEELGWLKAILRPGDTFVDVGAHVGFFSLAAAKTVGRQGRVIAIEPAPTLFEKLSKWVSKNDLSWIHPLPVAVGSKRGEASLFLDDDTNYAPSFFRGETFVSKVPVRPLDDIAEECGIEVIHLLKLDIEGSEQQAWEGAQRLIRQKRIKAVICEFNESCLVAAGTSSKYLWHRIVESGFADAEWGVSEPHFPAGNFLQNRLFFQVT